MTKEGEEKVIELLDHMMRLMAGIEFKLGEIKDALEMQDRG